MEPPTVREVARKLESEGYLIVSQKGSHARYRKGRRTVTLAGKPSDHLDRKTWERIQEQAGW